MLSRRPAQLNKFSMTIKGHSPYHPYSSLRAKRGNPQEDRLRGLPRRFAPRNDDVDKGVALNGA